VGETARTIERDSQRAAHLLAYSAPQKRTRTGRVGWVADGKSPDMKGQNTMSQKSSIEWTEETWNPMRGCTKVSPGCKYCYAEVIAEGRRGKPGDAYEYGFDLRLAAHKLTEPLRRREGVMIFVNSMSDFFHEAIPDDYVLDMCRVMETANHNTYQVLTKRSQRLQEMLSTELLRFADLLQIWWGVSVEDKKYGVPRIDHLRAAPAEVRFLSIEPLLEDIGVIDLTDIHWVIVGGESGDDSVRPMKREWVISIRDQCREAKVPFFFKQWGTLKNNPDPNDATAEENGGKAKGGRMLDGGIYDEMPERPFILETKARDRRALIAELEEKYKDVIADVNLQLLNVSLPQR
jgi:protein gp37